jgi:broad specificity phosphatase PhoE
VLVLTHADGHVECYAERGVTIHLTRVPAAFTPDGERQAEDVAEWLLPRRYRELWRADYLRANGTTRPLLPSTLAEAHTVTAIIDALNQATDSFAPTEESEAVAWTL